VAAVGCGSEHERVEQRDAVLTSGAGRTVSPDSFF
jgi:hypothetical protein